MKEMLDTKERELAVFEEGHQYRDLEVSPLVMQHSSLSQCRASSYTTDTIT